MVLLSPALLRVHNGHVVQESAAELLQLPFIRHNTLQHLLEDQLDLRFLIVRGVESIQAMVGQLAAHRSEEIMTLLQSPDEVGIRTDHHVSGFAEPIKIGLVGHRILDSHSLVGTPRRQDLGTERMLRYHPVPAQVVGGIISGADRLDIEPAYQSLSTELLRGQFGIALLEDVAGSLRLQDGIDAEHTAEFQMGPVIQGIAVGMGDRVRPFLELLPGAAVTGDVVLCHPVGTHRTPFVMVPSQPQLGHVTELDVLRYFPGIEMAVIVYDGQPLRVPVVKLTGMIAREHEIFMDEFHFRQVLVNYNRFVFRNEGLHDGPCDEVRNAAEAEYYEIAGRLAFKAHEMES